MTGGLTTPWHRDQPKMRRWAWFVVLLLVLMVLTLWVVPWIEGARP